MTLKRSTITLGPSLRRSWYDGPRLNRWTRNVAIRTEHAAMPLFGFQYLIAGCAFVKKLAVVGWHLYSFDEAAMRACKRALRNNIHNRILPSQNPQRPFFHFLCYSSLKFQELGGQVLYEVRVMIWRDLAFLIAGFLLGVSVAFWVLAIREWFRAASLRRGRRSEVLVLN